jgi:hypothetical protein
MEISTLSSTISAGAGLSVADQFSMYALKKTLSASQAQASALVQLMEQAPAPQGSGHQIDFYA